MTNLGVMCYNGYIGERGEAIMFDIFQEDQGLAHKLAHKLSAYYKHYKQKDDKEERKEVKTIKTTDSILQRLYKIYPGM